ncbi:5'/3'-nucleotidase SurE [Gordonia sp. L191]|uniref:5'/3'-nucleotidase SurE n=1 Tax=Gordonia sp. L191 TaxID=2982699 RepID=UPI0024C01D74|nr:5'/3'-nucleotidase SurE [Gordonia sp. L191]WHU46884.1 5'/3'-nucleotidase SurE [Gordonia sp. L191]
MRILVTNDDGYDAPGLSAAASALIEAGHDVIVAAPLTERSGSGSSLGSIEDGTHIPVLSTSLPGLGTTPVYAFDCPPALAVVACCAGSYGRAPDLVVSGVNPGHNTGRSILFSSTVGAVLAARVAGISGLAVSCGFPPAHRYDTAAAVITRIVEWMTESGSPRMSLNVNVPDVDYADLGGIRITALAARSMFSIRMSPAEGGLTLHREERSRGFTEGTDSAAVAAGYVSVTALSGVGDENATLELDSRHDEILGALERL